MELRRILEWRWLVILIACLFALFSLAMLFFDSLILSVVTTGFGLFMTPKVRAFNHQYLNRRIESEFITFIFSLSSFIGVGRSFEHAFTLSVQEMEKESGHFLLLKELRRISMTFDMNLSVGEAMGQLAEKYPVETILHFSHVCEKVLHKGGSLERVIEMSIQMVREKVEVEKELDVIITQKRFELIILLSFVPLMILYLRVVSGSFADLMYETLMGRGLMFICLLLYLLSGYIGRQIIDIEV